MGTKSGRVLCAVIAVGLLGSVAVAPVASARPRGQRAVIVRGRNAAAAVRALGGTPTLALDLIGGVAATMPTADIGPLEAEGLAVSPDAAARVASATYSPATVDTQVAALGAAVLPDVNAGAGVGVALVDTGVANTPDLNGRLVRGLDLTSEADGLDHYGHGTFMAGLIAGDGTGSPDGRIHRGVAPGATIISIKVAGASGATTLSKVIAGIGWAVVHQEEFHIRVLSLSMGVDPQVGYYKDPLSAAVEIAWASGLTTVVASGNGGAGQVTAPGRDPFVLTVGATDTTAGSGLTDATMPAWSSSEIFTDYAKPEVLAPGVSVISLRAPGSTIDIQNPQARVDQHYFRGSGTSMSTALTAGIAAILIQHHPNAAPDDVKGAIASTATAVPGSGIAAGEVNLDAALHATASRDWQQYWTPALPNLDLPWEDGHWTSTRWSSTRWSGPMWTAPDWSEQEWAGTWESTRWSDEAWDSTRWSSTRWSDSSWGDAVPSAGAV